MQISSFMLISKVMKQFIMKIAILLSAVCIVDILVGKAFSTIYSHTTGGNAGRNNYICDKTTEDILVFGSSRALHHYNPAILEDSLGFSCYNCGQGGNGVILHYGRLHLIKSRYRPQIIIFDVVYDFDLAEGDNHKYLGTLKPFYDCDGISEIFEDVDPKEKWKMRSKMYRYNSFFLSVLTDYLHPLHTDNKGFRPLEGPMDTMRIKKGYESLPKKKPQFDSLKIAYLNKFVSEADGVKLIISVSPSWYGIPPERLAPVRDICKKHNIPFIDFSNNPKYVHNNAYFKDGSHLNACGADEFTRDLTKEIKQLVKP